MVDNRYVSVAQLAKIYGISRIAVYKKIKKGQIKAIRIGNTYAIPSKYFAHITGKTLSKKDKKTIDEAVKKTFKEYGEVIKRLGNA